MKKADFMAHCHRVSIRNGNCPVQLVQEIARGGEELDVCVEPTAGSAITRRAESILIQSMRLYDGKVGPNNYFRLAAFERWVVEFNGRRGTDRPVVNSPYGYCPHCGAASLVRERRPHGNDTCANGHVYPSTTSRGAK